MILLSILVGLVVGMVGSIYDPYFNLFAQSPRHGELDYWRGTVDSKLLSTDEKFNAINVRLKNISEKIDGICDDVINIRIRSAESGGIYGGLSALVIYIAGLLVKSFVTKKNNKPK